MRNEPLVSVVMPCYNHEKYVGQAIESVLNQTYKNVEFIVLDNGSTDGSYGVIKQYEGKIDEIFHIDENDVEKAGTMLRERCTGQYIAFMTSDDFWEKDKLEKQMEVFIKHPEIKACFTWANEADENLVLQGEKRVFKEKNRSQYEWLRKILMEGNCFAYPSAVVEWETYRESIRELPMFYQLSDQYLWLLILLKYQVYVVEEPLVWFRWHGNGQNHNMSARNRETNIRTWNEDVIIVENIIEKMGPEVFKKAFADYLHHPEASSPEEIWCEKLFFLMQLADKYDGYGQSAINYYYKHSQPTNGEYLFEKTLKEKYQYTYSQFQSFCAKHGTGALLAKIIDAGKAKNLFAQTAVRYIEAMGEAADSERELLVRRRMWRGKIFASLSEEKKKIVQMMVQALDIVEKIDSNRYAEAIKLIQDLQEALLVLWEEFLEWDRDINKEEWDTYAFVISRPEITEEEYKGAIIPFIQKLKGTLKEYIGEKK